MTPTSPDRCPMPKCGGQPICDHDDGVGCFVPIHKQYCERCLLPRQLWSAVQALKDRVAELEAEVNKWRPWSPEEVDAALDDVECVPMSDEEITAMIERITDPTYRPNEPQHVQLLKRITVLKQENQALREQVKSLTTAMREAIELYDPPNKVDIFKRMALACYVLSEALDKQSNTSVSQLRK